MCGKLLAEGRLTFSIFQTLKMNKDDSSCMMVGAVMTEGEEVTGRVSEDSLVTYF